MSLPQNNIQIKKHCTICPKMMTLHNNAWQSFVTTKHIHGLIQNCITWLPQINVGNPYITKPDLIFCKVHYNKWSLLWYVAQIFAIPQISHKCSNVLWQQDDAQPFWSKILQSYLNAEFPARLQIKWSNSIVSISFWYELIFVEICQGQVLFLDKKHGKFKGINHTSK